VVHVIDLTSIPRVVPIKARPDGIVVHPEPEEKEVMAVAILSSPGFSPRTVLPDSICFGSAQDETRRLCGAGRVIQSDLDLNGDGEKDLVLSFPEFSTVINVGDPEACLTGKTASGARIGGCGALSWIPETSDPPGTGKGVHPGPRMKTGPRANRRSDGPPGVER
jgi:hypothetical protein